MPDSSISKFFEKDQKERLEIVGNFASLSEDDLKILEKAIKGSTVGTEIIIP